MDFVLKFGHNDRVWLDSAADYERVLPHIWRWTPQGVTTTIDGRPTLLHRYILDVSPELHVVFLDSNRRNCRRSNLFIVDRGYAALVDRTVYGLRGVTPVIRALEQVAADNDGPLTTWEQAEQRRAKSVAMINEIQALLGDRGVTRHLTHSEHSTWKSDLMRIRTIMERRIQEAKSWMATHRHLAPTDNLKDLHHLTPAQQTIIREQRLATRGARVRENLARITPSALEHVDPADSEILLRLAYMCMRTLGHRVNKEYTPIEDFTIKAIQSHFNLQGQDCSWKELLDALGLDPDTDLL